MIRRLSLGLLALIFGLALFADRIAPSGYGEQLREYPSVKPSRQFLLGTDELGRDRFSRLLYGSRVSLLLAPAAALLATIIGLLFGGIAGYYEGLPARIALGMTDLMAALPTLLVLLFARVMLPLNVDPKTSVTITFFLLAAVGWTSGVRVFAAAIARARSAEYVRQAHVAGWAPARIVLLHIVSAIRPVLAAQFWVLVPLFLLAEANLSMLGLGVSEPLPSWGNLLAEIQVSTEFWKQPWLLSPAALLLIVLLSLQGLLMKERRS
jgi:ABC-type dipeptide/oligopeptide/nickel transport system permease subunit